MSDSVDRVFSQALTAVNKISMGNEKPPAKVRLGLYGLYKQSMEGDVQGIMKRPTGTDAQAHQAREKWSVFLTTEGAQVCERGLGGGKCAKLCLDRDAWQACAGLARAEAKQRYITTLISNMRQYASSSSSSRALVEELEFVWNQVKSNVARSSSPSFPPEQQADLLNGGPESRIAGSYDKYQSARTASMSSAGPTSLLLPQSQSDSRAKSRISHSQISTGYPENTRTRVSGSAATTNRGQSELRCVSSSLYSQNILDDSDAELVLNPESDSDAQGEEFVDAPDSQIAGTTRTDKQPLKLCSSTYLSAAAHQPNPQEHDREDETGRAREVINDRQLQAQQVQNSGYSTPAGSGRPTKPTFVQKRQESSSRCTKEDEDEEKKWRRCVSSALIKLTAEIAALREQLEARRFFAASHPSPLSFLFSRRRSRPSWAAFTSFLFASFVAVLKHMAIDLLLLTGFLLWMRRKQDGRFKGAIRVLLGDAVAKVHQVQLGLGREVERVGRAISIGADVANGVVNGTATQR